MANNKWSKWFVSISTIAIFTSFLHLTKSPQDNPNSDELTLTNDEALSDFISAHTVTPTPISIDNQSRVELFVHTRKEMQQLQTLNPAAKVEREHLLESLDWSNLPAGEITLPTRLINPTEVTRAKKSDRNTKRS